jgi:hypothetical protein
MPSEFFALREAWLALEEPSEEVREDARARLFEEIALEDAEGRGHPREQDRSRSGFRLHSRLAISVVLALVLLLTWSALTLAFGWHVVFGSAQRAAHNSKVFKDFDTLDVGAPAGMESGVIPNQTRLVATFGRVRLWVAPTRAGGYCSLIAGGGGCDRLGTVPLNVTYAFVSEPGRGGDPTVQGLAPDLADLREVDGSINTRWSETVEVRFEDGAVLRPRIVWVSEPISQGFFYLPIGDDHRRAGHQLREVVALDADGNVVAADSMSGRPYSNGPPPGSIVDEAEQVARVETPIGEAVLWHAPSRSDSSCTWLELAGRFYLGAGFHGCQITGYSSRWHGELVRRGNLVLFYAFGLPSGGSVRLDFADRHHVRLRPDRDGFLLYRVPQPASLASGQPWSYTVVAPGGKRLLHTDLSLPSLTSPADAERPVRLPDGQVAFLPRKAIVAKARKLVDFRAEDGTPVTLWFIPMRGGGSCFVLQPPVSDSGCAPPGSHAPPLGAGIHGGASLVLLEGQVREDVATYELRYEDGAVERLHPVEGFILHEITSSHYSRGHRLESVIARARDGHELARQAIPDRATGVYPCEKPVDVGHGVRACP